jgi:hypothetical protein
MISGAVTEIPQRSQRHPGLVAQRSRYSLFLAPGERGHIVVIAADKKRAGPIFRYLKALLSIPLLGNLIERETQEVTGARTSARFLFFAPIGCPSLAPTIRQRCFQIGPNSHRAQSFHRPRKRFGASSV